MNDMGIINHLKYNEYYNMQSIFDSLYQKSTKNYKFKNLIKNITSENNIELAFKTIKLNQASKINDLNNEDINFINSLNKTERILLVRNKLKNYSPEMVNKVFLPKHNGTTRFIGIPSITDRLVQQCILQILDPICEAKFYYRSFGFRFYRSTKHAIGASMNLINFSKVSYSVDLNINNFFENVNHGKLLKQLWSLGLQDKNLLSIISKMLKSEIHKEGIPHKGIIQCGILTPLFSNIVLNELDWWIANQWESYPLDVNYKRKDGKDDNSEKYRQLRKSTLKEIYIVRYGNDFKIFCKDYKTAQKIFIATKNWLNERLQLQIDNKTSKITNLRKNYTSFLGVEMKAFYNSKSKRYSCKSRPTKKAINTIIRELKARVKDIQWNGVNRTKIIKLNAHILATQNYYNMTSMVAEFFSKINWIVSRYLEKHLSNTLSKNKYKSETYKRIYKGYNGNFYSFSDITIFCIYGVAHSPPIGIKRRTSLYTIEGRTLLKEQLLSNWGQKLAIYLLKNDNGYDDIKLRDTKISKIISQGGRCYVTKKLISPGNMHCHHRIPKAQNGSNAYNNLYWVRDDIHRAIHSTNKDTYIKILNEYELKPQMLKNLNYLRKNVGNDELKFD